MLCEASHKKDSQTVYHLCKEAGVKFDAHYSHTTVDPPEVIYFMRQHYPDVIVDYDTELLNMELIRKDQIYFADKSRKDGSSSLYSISEFATPTTENVRKGYLMGKYGAIPKVEIANAE